MKHIKFYKSKQLNFAFYCDEQKITLDEFLGTIDREQIISINLTDNDGGERIHIFWS